MLQDLQTNLEKLIAAYETEKRNAGVYREQAERYKKLYEDALEQNRNQEGIIDNLNLRNVFSFSSDESREKAVAEIDGLISEIDAALELLK